MKNQETINIEDIMKYMSQLDTLDLDEWNFIVCKIDSWNNLPLVVFDKDTENYYFFETIWELEDKDTWWVNLEAMYYLYTQKEEKIIFIYKWETYWATYWKFDYTTTKEYYSKNDKFRKYFWCYLYQEWFFFFDHQRYVNKYWSTIFDWKYYDQLVEECKRYIETKTNYKINWTELEIAKWIFEYIFFTYTYAWYMLSTSNQKDFDKLACEKPEAFFLPDILKKRECVCQSYSQLFLMLCLKFIKWNFDVHTIMIIPWKWWINHVRNIWKFDWKYYFVDLTIKKFKEISEKEYKKYLEEELYSWKFTIENWE